MTRRAALALACACALACAAAAAPAQAQSFGAAAFVSAGNGVEIGSGDGQTIVQRSRLFIDIGARTWTDELREVTWGGSVRVEVEGRASVAFVPRAELEQHLGPLAIRPGAGVPMFIAPFTMVGVEGSLMGVLSLGRTLGVFGAVLIDAFFLGTDVPNDSAVLMFNGAIGVELAL